jgi:polyisoprenoid-binding protein YceI
MPMFQQRFLTHILTLFLLASLLLAGCVGNSGEEPTGGNEPATAETPVPTAAVEEPAQEAVEPEQQADKAVMQTFVIVPAESRASYVVDEEFLELSLSKLGIDAGSNDTVGSTHAVEGQIDLNLDDLSAALGENSFSVDLSTLESDQDRRDTWIRENGPSFNRFPMAYFTATSLSGLPDSYQEGEEIQFQVDGDLTIHEVTVPVTFDATATLEGDTLTGVLVTQSLISNFGIEPPSFARTLTVADEFGIQVEFTAHKQ